MENFIFCAVIHGGGGLYTEPFLCLEFFTPVVFISWKTNGIRQKTMLFQENAILLQDSKQNTWYLSQFETISFIKTQKHLSRCIICSRCIKNNTAPHILYFYDGLIFRVAYIRNYFCVNIFMGLYTGRLIFGVLWYMMGLKKQYIKACLRKSSPHEYSSYYNWILENA